MNAYKQLKDKHQKEMNAFPLGAAFSDKQFEEMMQKWGLTVNDADKICSIGGGCFIRKSDKAAFFEMPIRPARDTFTICSSTSLPITNTALHTTTRKPLTHST